MALDFQQVRLQVNHLGEKAPARQQLLQARRRSAQQLLAENAEELERVRAKIDLARSFEPNLRCARPVDEALTAHIPCPAQVSLFTLLAADGSQITPDRHAEVDFGLINVGAIQMRPACPEPPQTFVESQLYYDEELYSPTGLITEARLGTLRDLRERAVLARLAQDAPAPVLTLTDGPLELWGSEGDSAVDFKHSLEEYLQALHTLYELGTTTAGYVDKPGGNLVVRLLEVLMASEADLADLRRYHPLRGVSDIELYREMLDVGERSGVFALQSYSERSYTGPLALHFFYLNVGRPGRPWLARVEIPAWVAADPQKLDLLHASLVDQCRILGSRPYPYILHRAHEAAVVSLQEKEQVTQMIALELRRRGVAPGQISNKQAHKDSKGRTGYRP
jgi:hypothetical protein